MHHFFVAALILLLQPAAFAKEEKRGLHVIYASSGAEELSRAIASSRSGGAPQIQYLTYRGDTPQVERVDLARWRDRFSDGGRYDYLLKFYFANTRDVSNSGLKHAACFEGDAGQLARGFFDEKLSIRNLVGDVIATPSSDGFLIGFQFQVRDPQSKKLRDAHFRLPNCSSSGKAEVISDSELAGRPQRDPDSAGASRAPASAEEEAGFKILDVVTGSTSVPKFEMRTDFERASMGPNDRPWKGMDISTEEGAFKFSELVQAYFYEDMANQNRNPDLNFVAKQNSKRFWCHMPWLNVGNAGREALHGMTMERDLQPSTMYPNAPAGSDWGIGYYNAAGCKTLGQIFGSPSSGIKAVPAWDKTRFEDGAMSVKILFTTADFEQLKGTFTWTANVSLPKKTARKPQPVRHVQMDIAVIDSTLKGVNASNRNWVMTSYYYDPTYTASPESPLRRIANLPEGFLHMRPFGTQVGFEKKDSIIFTGAKTNQIDGRLNGPADNPKSTCLGCHATAGTSVPMAPGIMSNADFQAKVLRPGKHLDYSQQVALAKRNYETRFRSRAGAPDQR